LSVAQSERKSFFKKVRSGQDDPNAEMSFIDHLEVLRWHIVRSAAVVLIAAIFIFIYIDWIYDNIIIAPTQSNFVTYIGLCNLGHRLHLGDALCMPPVKIQLVIYTISGTFSSAINIAIMGGLIVGLPYLLWELWRFVKPALSTKELRYARGSIGWLSLCFFTGAAFGYYLLAPFTFNFLASFKLGNLGAQTYLPSQEDYIDTLVDIILGCGIAFELPIVSYVLAKIGLISSKFLKTYRKYAYVLILIIAAVITPSPDWTSQTIVAVPLILLYEISIFITRRVDKENLKKEQEWA
jgi:sec-independent protein translocase protein TatC